MGNIKTIRCNDTGMASGAFEAAEYFISTSVKPRWPLAIGTLTKGNPLLFGATKAQEKTS